MINLYMFLLPMIKKSPSKNKIILHCKNDPSYSLLIQFPSVKYVLSYIVVSSC